MSHTNSTTNYGLPQFLTSDKPAWLTDINNAFSNIDTAIDNAQTKADTAYTDAGNAQLDATTAINNAAAADAKGSGALASIETAFDPATIYAVGSKVMYNSLLYRCIVAVTTPGPWTGSDNWERITVDTLIASTDSKVGNLSSLSTSDKASLVNAVNEVNGKESYIIRTTQVTIPSVNVPANTSTSLINDVDVRSLTYSALDNISGVTGTLVGAVVQWCSGGGGTFNDTLVSGGKLSCSVYLPASRTVNAIRVLCIFKQ